jgi:DNA-binding NtrC family response regulator
VDRDPAIRPATVVGRPGSVATGGRFVSDAVHRILIADGDAIVAEAMAEMIRRYGHEVTIATDGVAAVSLSRAARERADAGRAVLVIDPTTLDDGDRGLELLAAVQRADPGIVPVVVTGFGTIEQAVAAVRTGAADYLVKPVDESELRAAIDRAVSRHLLVADRRRRRAGVPGPGELEIVGDDARMQQVMEVVDAVARSRTTVLMNGESGTGKSMIARAIHCRSDRGDGPFVEIACGSIPETLLESELFGHVQGAFTGAVADKPGRFQAAHGGTLFLDEINSASPAMQLKLLRVLQERTFEPVGSSRSLEVDVRVVLASNQPLEQLVAEGRFRQDLYYRIAVIPIDLPPLRARRGDVLRLAEHFLAVKAAEADRLVTGFSDAALEAMAAYHWPGNVRELENIIERAVVLTRQTRIGVADLPPHVRGEPAEASDLAFGAGGTVSPPGGVAAAGALVWAPDPAAVRPLRDALEEPERLLILQALEAHEWNRQATAEALGINRTTLYKKMRQLGLDREAA